MKLIKQRLAGLFFLAVTVLCLWLTYHGQTPEDRDGTVILFTAPSASTYCSPINRSSARERSA